MTRDEALLILKDHIKNKNLIRHGVAVEAIMAALARHFSQNEQEWALAGLLHDMDWEETKGQPERHSEVAREILEKTDLPPEVVRAVYVHNYLHNIKPETLLEKALYCVEELSGLITAAALVQPDRKLASVTEESIIKKFKSKSFAAGVNREIILLSPEMIGLELPELVKLALSAMQERADEIGL